jgi:hypothetical protein
MRMSNELEHFGTKGMRWGVRKKSTGGSSEATVKESGKKLKVSGGEGHGAHSDAVSAAKAVQKIKKSGIKSLSNQELQAVNSRLGLEQKYSQIVAKNKQANALTNNFFVKQLKEEASRSIYNNTMGGIKKVAQPFITKQVAGIKSDLAEIRNMKARMSGNMGLTYEI